jgi:hypothetical protein
MAVSGPATIVPAATLRSEPARRDSPARSGVSRTPVRARATRMASGAVRSTILTRTSTARRDAGPGAVRKAEDITRDARLVERPLFSAAHVTTCMFEVARSPDVLRATPTARAAGGRGLAAAPRAVPRAANMTAGPAALLVVPAAHPGVVLRYLTRAAIPSALTKAYRNAIGGIPSRIGLRPGWIRRLPRFLRANSTSRCCTECQQQQTQIPYASHLLLRQQAIDRSFREVTTYNAMMASPGT